MKPVQRHVPDSVVAERLRLSEPGLLELGLKVLIEKSEPRTLATSIRHAIWIAGLEDVNDPRSEVPCGALKVASSLSAGLFRLMAEAPGEYPIPIGDGRKAVLPNIGVTSETHVARWTRGYYIATIVRDHGALASLGRTPVAELRRSSTRGDEHLYSWAETLQKFERGDSGTMAKLQVAIDGTDPAVLSEDGSKTEMLQIRVPEMQVFYRLVCQEPGPFNEALQLAVEQHKKYWSAAKRKNDPAGFIALGPLAFACRAHDIGLPVTVESDYLPRRLIEGACRTA
jgi:hypothetical protein